MKNIKYSFGVLLALMMFATSCVDSVDPNIPYATFDTATYLRTIRSAPNTSTSFNFFDLSNAKFSLTLEAVDGQGGTSVDNVQIRVRHRRLIPGVGLEYVPVGTGTQVNDVLIKTLSGSEFVAGAENPNHPTQNYTRTSFEISAAEAIQAVGLTPAQIQGGDTFEFRLVLTDVNGRVFGPDNRSSDVAGGLFYDSPFLYNVSVVCPSDLAGTFAYSTVVTGSPYGPACNGQTLTGNVTWTKVTPTGTAYTVSDASFGLFACTGDSWGAGNVRINDSCGLLSFAGADKYGGSYTFTFVSNTGTELTFDWINSFNESGRTTLTASSGSTWPPGLR